MKDALESENQKTKEMEERIKTIFLLNIFNHQESMAKLDSEMKKSDDLLSQMMPKSVAEKIKVKVFVHTGLSPFSRTEHRLSRPAKFSKW